MLEIKPIKITIFRVKIEQDIANENDSHSNIFNIPIKNLDTVNVSSNNSSVTKFSESPVVLSTIKNSAPSINENIIFSLTNTLKRTSVPPKPIKSYCKTKAIKLSGIFL